MNWCENHSSGARGKFHQNKEYYRKVESSRFRTQILTDEGSGQDASSPHRTVTHREQLLGLPGQLKHMNTAGGLSRVPAPHPQLELYLHPEIYTQNPAGGEI